MRKNPRTRHRGALARPLGEVLGPLRPGSREVRRETEGGPPDAEVRRSLRDVAPLRGAVRVPKAPGSVPEPRRVPHARRGPLARHVAFVVTWEGGAVRAHRAELGPRALDALDDPRWRPEDSLDLHGRRTRGLERAVTDCLRRASSRGVSRVLLIHGKGLHSPGGRRVLFDLVVAELTTGEASNLVRAFRTARETLGGDGALQIELQGRRP